VLGSPQARIRFVYGSDTRVVKEEREVGADEGILGGGRGASLPSLPSSASRSLLSTFTRLQGFMNHQDRKDFPWLLAALGLTNVVVEVGVADGEYSQHMLENWAGSRYVMIDPWMHFADDTYLDGNNNITQVLADRRFEAVATSVGGAALHSASGLTRAAVIRLQSHQAALLIEDESVDFIFIDAQHDYLSVITDMTIWWPKVRVGGIMAGHDYNNDHYGCVYAVNEYARKMGLQVHVTKDYSWYVFKSDNNRL
jgi:hypothetical protein